MAFRGLYLQNTTNIEIYISKDNKNLNIISQNEPEYFFFRKRETLPLYCELILDANKHVQCHRNSLEIYLTQ